MGVVLSTQDQGEGQGQAQGQAQGEAWGEGQGLAQPFAADLGRFRPIASPSPVAGNTHG